MFTFTTIIVIFAYLVAIASGYTSYNSETQICCNGTVAARENYDSCCGQQPYEYAKFLCCNDQLLPIEEDSTTMACCIKPDSGIAEVYNNTFQRCCAGKVVDKPDDQAFYTCCGQTLYNDDTQLCCGNTLVDLQSDLDCCGDTPYDYNSKVCCSVWDDSDRKWNYGLADLEDNKSECCNGEPFDPEESICCDDTIVDIPQGIEDSETASCCGSVVYDTSKQTCCYQRVEDTESSEPEERYTPVDIEGERDRCCGNILYDDDTEICCDYDKSKVEELPADDDDESYYLCCGEGLVYNGQKQLCFNGEVVDQPHTRTYVCGNEIIDFRNQSCCYDVPFDDDSSLACCHLTKSLYNTDTDICCDGEDELVARSDENDACCSVVYY